MMFLFGLLVGLSPSAQAGLKSLALPGWGQFSSGQSAAGWTFLGVEAVSWAGVMGFRVKGDRLAEESRIWAYQNAGARPYWGEEYWAEMEKYMNYDDYIQGLWAEARTLFPDDPEEQAAYVDSVKLPERWEWRDKASKQEFMRLRSASRNAFSLSSTMIGVILANHLFAGIEAFVYAQWFAGSRLEGTGLRFRFLPEGGVNFGFTRTF
jgi:hypothetical protein